MADPFDGTKITAVGGPVLRIGREWVATPRWTCTPNAPCTLDGVNLRFRISMPASVPHAEAEERALAVFRLIPWDWQVAAVVGNDTVRTAWPSTELTTEGYTRTTRQVRVLGQYGDRPLMDDILRRATALYIRTKQTYEQIPVERATGTAAWLAALRAQSVRLVDNRTPRTQP